jgi:ribosomal protein S18 acetylase RimI-like enzyme
VLEFVRVDLNVHREILKDLSEEYLGWVAEQFREHYGIEISAPGEQTVREYARKSVNNVAAYAPPQGICYLLKLDGEMVGMGALRQVRDGVGEIKRMYVRPKYRGRGIGRALLKELLGKAREYGYSTILLDTAKWMTIAQRMYHSAGFRYREEYPESEIPQSIRHLCVFMEKDLDATHPHRV